MELSGFHPVIAEWFRSRFEEPTEPQKRGWPAIAAGEHTLIAAPTGSGKTLTAFLGCIDRLFREALAGDLEDETRVVYVSPLRALSNDMHRNLEVPLTEITALNGGEAARIRTGLRTGDTPSSRRAAMVRRPPHILVTTPESLYLMLTARKSREILRGVETVIVDEIHALVRDKRGSHLALTLERLEALTEGPLQRIGLSATQKPIERMAAFLVGAQASPPYERGGNFATKLSSPIAPLPHPPPSHGGEPSCNIIDVGHGRELDLAIEVSPGDLGAVCTHEQWAEHYQRLVELIREHRSTLIFVNTRKLAERVTYQLTELLGEEVVGAHHGSLSASTRIKTERGLKSGALKAVVATASLELGIDIGSIDLVVQIGSPRSIATFLQRIGRSGHSLGRVPKGRLFALSRDQLLECMALIRAVRAGRLDTTPVPEAPLDVLAQQIVAEVAAGDWNTDDLFELFRRAYPYRDLSRRDFDETVEYLSEGIAKFSGRSRVYLHHDRVNRRLRARRGARIAATSNAGAIPEIADFRVVAEPDETVVGTLDEDFAIESNRGDIFLLGNNSWQIQHVRGGEVRVADAHGAPPTVPFWRGEAPGRTFELSEEVSRLREDIEHRLGDGEQAAVESSEGAVVEWLRGETACSEHAARQAATYIAAQKAAIGVVPTQKRVVFERFFDETGGMQLVVHAPFGSAVNQAWGLAMRKRFCRSFDFELQATADNEGFILSLGPQHSFPIESLFSMLNTENIRPLVEQAVLAAPMFEIRWRWNVTRALLVARMRNGKKVPPALQRFRADDLLSAVFPRLAGCFENHAEQNIEIPDHPLVRQTIEDCLHEALDIEALLRVLGDVESGAIQLIPRETREPSPFCHELLNSDQYAFLDDGEIQERRARAVSTRRSLNVEEFDDLTRLDPAAIEQVRQEARPLIRDADELHDVLLSRMIFPTDELGCPPCEGGPQGVDNASPWGSGAGGGDSQRLESDPPQSPLRKGGSDVHEWYRQLESQNRAATIRLPDNREAWIPAERLPAARAVFPEARPSPELTVPEGVRQDWSAAEARTAMVQGLMETCGPTTAEEIGRRLAITASQAEASLEALEGAGVVLRGRFTPAEVGQFVEADGRQAEKPDLQWCHRRLLARIHRLTLQGLRREIEPVGVEVFVRYLARYHGLVSADRRAGPNGLFEVISMLQGVDAPAVAWERDLLPARLTGYRAEWLDELCLTGEVAWGRLFPPRPDPDKARPMTGITRVVPVSLVLRNDIDWLTAIKPTGRDPSALSGAARDVYETLQHRGAMFAADLLSATRLLPAQLDDALGELVSRGLVTADGFGGLRQLIAEKGRSAARRRRKRDRLVRRRAASAGTGRWSLWRRDGENEAAPSDPDRDRSHVEEWAWQLLRRWGVVFRDLLTREPGAPQWFELLQVYRRLEARGEIRGGRFVRGVGGEQFALGETVRQLRQIRDEGPQEELVVLSAADPLNLIGILTQHARVPSTATNRVAYLDGRPVAALQAGEILWLGESPPHLHSLILERLGFSVSTAVPPDGVTDPEADETPPGPSNGARNTKRKSRPPSGIPRPRIW